MKRLDRKRWKIGLGALLFFLSWQCSSQESASPPKEEAKKAPSARHMVPSSPLFFKVAPLDPNLLPLDSLQKLSTISLQGQAPCSAALLPLQATFDIIIKERANMSVAQDTSQALAALQTVSSQLETAAKDLSIPSESKEMRRLSLELQASLRDLSESLGLLIQSTQKNDTSSVEAIMARIQNSVDNTKITTESFLQQCTL